MLELLGSGALGSLFGGLFRLAPEIIKLFNSKDERAHELEMFKLQTNLELQRGEFTMEGKYVDHSTATLEAIQQAMVQQGEADSKAWKWVASLSALVRPAITYWFMALYSGAKFAAIYLAYQMNQNMSVVLQQTWTTEDFGLLSMILTFWFVGRAIEKYRT